MVAYISITYVTKKVKIIKIYKIVHKYFKIYSVK